MGRGEIRTGNYGKFGAKNTKFGKKFVHFSSNSCRILSSWKEMVFE
jgi:hypothetical protein